jgi:hypothetical protein
MMQQGIRHLTKLTDLEKKRSREIGSFTEEIVVLEALGGDQCKVPNFQSN